MVFIKVENILKTSIRKLKNFAYRQCDFFLFLFDRIQYNCFWRKLRNIVLSNDAIKLNRPIGIGELTGGIALKCKCSHTMNNYLSSESTYQQFLINKSFLSCAKRNKINKKIKRFEYDPTISILLPVYRVETEFLLECLRSVEEQIYPHWELCIVEDGCNIREVKTIITDFSSRYPDKVKFLLRDENLGIVKSSQEALRMATGEFIALLDHDDRLAPDALFEVVLKLNNNPETDWIYSDNDKISENGLRCSYHPKPDWSPELLLTYNYILHFSVLRRSLVTDAGGFRDGYDGSQDHDLYLRIAEKTDNIIHISKVLYSWRQSPDSVSIDPSKKIYAYDAAIKALDDALVRRGEQGEADHASNSWFGSYRMFRHISENSIDLVVFGMNQSTYLETIEPLFQNSIIKIKNQLVHDTNQSVGDTLATALSKASSPFLLIIHENMRLESNDVLVKLLSNMVPDKVAATGPKIITNQGVVDHCGIGFTKTGRMLFPLRGMDTNMSGHGAHGALPRNVSALSPLFTIFDTTSLKQTHGFNKNFHCLWAAVADACFNLRKNGFRITVDGGISVNYQSDRYYHKMTGINSWFDAVYFMLRNRKLLKNNDPYYNCNLRLEPADFNLKQEDLI